MRSAPPVPVVRSAPPVQKINPHLQPTNPHLQPTFDDLFSSGTQNNSGPGWDNPPAVTSPTSSGFNELNIFEKNSATVEQVLNNDGLGFTPIVDAKNESTKFHQDNFTTVEHSSKSLEENEDQKKGYFYQYLPMNLCRQSSILFDFEKG